MKLSLRGVDAALGGRSAVDLRRSRERGGGAGLAGGAGLRGGRGRVREGGLSMSTGNLGMGMASAGLVADSGVGGRGRSGSAVAGAGVGARGGCPGSSTSWSMRCEKSRPMSCSNYVVVVQRLHIVRGED